MVAGVAIIRDRWAHRSSRSPLPSVTTNDSTDSTPSTTSSEQEFVALASREQHETVHHHPGGASGSAVAGEAEGGEYTGSGGSGYVTGSRVLARNPSIGSQSSLEGGGAPSYSTSPSTTSASATSTTSSTSNNRGPSSPRIRAFAPDGRHHPHHETIQTASSYPPSRSSRSPSPARASSLDVRTGSSAGLTGSGPRPMASPSLMAGASSTIGTARSAVRCLSPLLIPPPNTSTSSLGSSSDGVGPAPPASPLGSLQPDLYQRRDGPVFLSARRHGATGRGMGRLHLRLKYDFDRSDLHVHLIEAHDLAGTDQGGFNDPYVKLTLSPEVDNRKRQTPIHRNDPNPFFDQHFKFPVSHEQLQDKTLLLQVFDYDRFSRNDMVGSVRVAMEELELVSSSTSIEVWGEIAREKKPPEEIQQVLLSLSYLPSAERLTVLILKARNLFPPQDKEVLDPFVKVSLLSGDKRVKKKKTAVRKATRCPVWNEAMSFNVAAGALASSAIEICVLDSSCELMGGNAIVGSCIVGPAIGGSSSVQETEPATAANQSREHWLLMSNSPRKAIAMWHTLH